MVFRHRREAPRVRLAPADPGSSQAPLGCPAGPVELSGHRSQDCRAVLIVVLHEVTVAPGARPDIAPGNIPMRRSGEELIVREPQDVVSGMPIRFIVVHAGSTDL